MAITSKTPANNVGRAGKVIETELPIGNYYGTVLLVKRGQKYNMELENWDGKSSSFTISKETYNSLQADLNKQTKRRA